MLAKLGKKKKVEAEGDAGGADEDLVEVDLKRGDYQIQVRIYEARELAPRDASGTSDPVVEVECLGKKLTTDKKTKTLSAVWDRVLFFQFSNLEPDDIENGTVEMSVMDSNAILSNTLIGAYEVDLLSVYKKKNHKFKGWAGLIDSGSEENKGVQGYLKFSITVLGPGDEAPVEEEDDDAGDLSKGGVLMPPRLEQEDWIICVQIFEATGLPRMDKMGDAGVDAFISFKLGNGKPVDTTIVKSRDPVWNLELHIPFSMPSMVKNLIITMMDYDKTSRNDTIATHRIDVSKLKIQEDESNFDPPAGCVAFWINFYGAPKSGSFTQAGDSKIADRMNNSLMEGTHYDGRLLLRLWKKKVHSARMEYVQLPRGSGKENPERKHELKQKKKHHVIDIFSFDLAAKQHDHETRNCTSLTGFSFPDISDYRLYFSVFDAVEIPFDDGKEISIEVSWGNQHAHTSSEKVRGGAVSWNPADQTRQIDAALPNLRQENPAYDRLNVDELKKELRKQAPGRYSEQRLATMSEARLRSELNQVFVGTSMLPDVFVYLKKGDTKVAYIRLPARRLLGHDFVRPTWLLLKEDLCLNAIPQGEMPGTVLLRMKLFRRSGFQADVSTHEPLAEFNKRVSEEWDALVGQTAKKEMIPYDIRCHLYQASELPAADSNGSLDPFIVVQCAGVRAKSTVCYQTTSPAWYETVTLRDVMLPKDINLAPNIYVVLFDEDKMSKEVVGRFVVKTIDQFERVRGEWHSRIKEDIDEPDWNTRIFLENPAVFDVGGKVLCSWQIYPSAERNLYERDHEWPDMIDATIEINAIGLRGLLPSPFPVNAAFVEFDCGNMKATARTKLSKVPSGTNPNHLEVYKLKTLLPENPKFAPSLNLRVFDVRAHGLVTMMISCGSIPLFDLLPWNIEPFVKSLAEVGVEAPPVVLQVRSQIAARQTQNDDDDEDDDSHNPKAPLLRESMISGVTSGTSVGPPKRVRLGSNDSGSTSSSNARPQSSAQPQGGNIELTGRSKVGVGYKKATGKSFLPLNQGDSSGDEEHQTQPAAHASADAGDWKSDWMLDRAVVDDELEDTFATSPFHDVDLFSGGGDKKKKAGMFKGYVQILPEFFPTEDDQELPYEPPHLPFKLSELMKPAPYLARVYILRAFQLMPKDRGGTCDPFVHIRCGIKAKPIQDRDHRKMNISSECYFYRCYEVPVTLPGPMLEVSIYDWNRIGSDELIGTTAVDLTNRWFNKEWQAITNKSVERRSLWSPLVGNPQGKLEMWVDIIQKEDAKKYPAHNIAPPPPQMFELRVVVWRTRKLPSMDRITGLNDLFVRLELESPGHSEVKETDTHWRSKKGRGNFNYRLVFLVQFDPADPKDVRLKISAWDRDIVTSNDSIGEVAIPMRPFFVSAYNSWRKRPANQATTNSPDDAKAAPDPAEEIQSYFLWGQNREEQNREYPVPNKWLSLGKGKGDILMTVELIHEADAGARKVGEGRDSPNQHPFLHPPVRPKFDIFSPISTLALLVGPDIWNRFKCLICCACLCVCFAFLFVGLSYVRIWFI